MRLALAAPVAALALAGAGCGTGGVAAKGNAQSGEQLFKQHCAFCHTLAAAGANGKTGPNLDDAFAGVRRSGHDWHFQDSTIRQVVADQIKFPAQRDEGPNMPPDLVKGHEVDDVAAYVASVAGAPASAATAAAGAGAGAGTSGAAGATTKSTNGKTIFTSSCASCHTLAAAGTHGTVGPNLDKLKPPFAIVKRQVTNGGAVMPAFKGKLTAAQIAAVAKYVSGHAGKK